MKKIIIPLIAISLLAILSVQSSLAVFDYSGVNERYASAMREEIKASMSDHYPYVGLLDTICLFREDSISIVITIDNATALNVYNAVQGVALAYIAQYYKNNWSGWPAAVTIYVNKAGGTQIGVGEVYSKWVDDLLKDSENHSTAQKFVEKVWGATRIWTWQLPEEPEP